jgi:hypothetical protein
MPDERQPDDTSITPAPPVGEDAWSGESSSSAEPAVAPRTPGKAVAALVCGIISLVIGGIILGIVAVVLGSLARKEIAEHPGLTGSGMALAGIITGSLGFVLAVVFLAIGVGFMS